MTSDIEALRSEVSRLTRERDSLLVAIGEHVTVRSDQYAQIQRLQAALERWSHDGHLQTFEDRERFRAEARALLSDEPNSAPETSARRLIDCKHERAKVQCPDCGIDFLGGIRTAPRDVPIWICSVCGGWNHMQDKFCTHTHAVEQPEKACAEPSDAEKRAMCVDLDSRDHEAR